LTESFPVPLPERIGVAQRLLHGRITLGRALIGPDEDILQEVYFVQLINAEDRIRIA